jgi:TetR/AcrR family transcriptional regulator
MREGEGYTLDETLLASQLLAFCEGMLSRFVRSEFKYRPTDDFDARWPLVAAQLQYFDCPVASLTGLFRYTP